MDVGSSSVRCTAYALRPGGRAVAVPGTMAQVLRDALDPGTGTADAGRVLADVEAVVDGCLGCVRACLHVWGLCGHAMLLWPREAFLVKNLWALSPIYPCNLHLQCRALRAEGLAHLVKVVGFAAFVMNLVGVDAVRTKGTGGGDANRRLID